MTKVTTGRAGVMKIGDHFGTVNFERCLDFWVGIFHRTGSFADWFLSQGEG